MGPRGAAAVAVGLWVLVTAGEAADPGVTTPRRCLLSHYRSLDPRAVAAVKALRDRYVSDAQTSPPVPEGPLRPSAQQEEETLSWRPRNCSFRAGKDPRRPWVRLASRRGRPIPEFPGHLRDPGAAGGRAAGRGDLPRAGPARLLEEVPQATEDASPNTQSCERSGRGGARLRLLPGFQDSPGCHEASVIFNLLRLLTWDLRLVADSGPCL
ncbi:interferon lambda-4-like [Neofelis nebulosa]|uniref:interferon lambda-4-like n=1 Tax=Neofelis nebulosa TaxID=61452 RepID=UPI00272A9E0F|nr:interferon lambda-4-like [Neofelis nebulosa]